MKFEDGLIVTAGTINPHAPRTAIPSECIPRWLEYGKDPKDPGGTQEPTSTTK